MSVLASTVELDAAVPQLEMLLPSRLKDTSYAHQVEQENIGKHRKTMKLFGTLWLYKSMSLVYLRIMACYGVTFVIRALSCPIHDEMHP